MKKDGYIKGILVGIIITLTMLLFMGFGNSTPGHHYLNPLYVKLVKWLYCLWRIENLILHIVVNVGTALIRIISMYI